jgi:hypothetical protein
MSMLCYGKSSKNLLHSSRENWLLELAVSHVFAKSSWELRDYIMNSPTLGPACVDLSSTSQLLQKIAKLHTTSPSFLGLAMFL